MNHTPKITFDGRGLNDLHDPFRRRLFTAQIQDWEKLREIGPYIETACNAHEELVDVLKLCKRNVEAQLYMLPYDASEQKDILSSWIGRINGALSLATIEKGDKR